MTTAARSLFLKLLRDGEQELRDNFQAFSERARTFLLNAADSQTGKIALQDWKHVEQQISGMLLYYFLDNGGSAYTVVSNGALIPRTPFMRLLWRQVEQATQQAVAEQADALRRSLKNAPDILKALEQAKLDPFLAYYLLVDDDVDSLFEDYVPQYDFLRGDHKRLQDRVLLTAAETRRKVGLLISQQLSEGKTAKEIAAMLQQFLTGKLTAQNRPYGTTGFFDASRLLAGETTFANMRAGLMSAALNPLVTEVDWVLSNSHKVADECDTLAENSPYELKSVPPFPAHSQCLCHLEYRTHNRVAATVERLRGSERLNVRGALSPGFAELLLRGQ